MADNSPILLLRSMARLSISRDVCSLAAFALAMYSWWAHCLITRLYHVQWYDDASVAKREKEKKRPLWSALNRRREMLKSICCIEATGTLIPRCLIGISDGTRADLYARTALVSRMTTSTLR